MEYSDVKGWVDVAKSSFDLLKGAAALLPKGPEKAELEARLDKAALELKKADVKLAKELGYNLCQCEFPPNVMLWKEAEQAHVCPACGHRVARRVAGVSSVTSRGGPNSWMRR